MSAASTGLDRLRRSERRSIAADLGDFPDGKAGSAQRSAIHEFGDDIRAPAFAADVEHGDDIRMTQRGDVACFLLESRQVRGIRGHRRRQYFQRNIAPKSCVTSALHLTHSTAPSGAMISYAPNLVAGCNMRPPKHSQNGSCRQLQETTRPASERLRSSWLR
jgi:hypothetical protein